MTRLLLLILLLLGTTVHAQHDRTLEVKIGQMIMVGFRGFEADSESAIAEDLRKGRAGGVILFDYDVPAQRPIRNIRSPGQVTSLIDQLQSVASQGLFVAVDQEGGRVARLTPDHGFPETVSAESLGVLGRLDSTRAYSNRQATMLNRLGFNINFAPVVDLNTNPDNPVIGKLGRSYSANPDTVFRQAAAVVDSYQKHDIVPVLKHFPGHGSAWNDSHAGMADVTDTWSAEELAPYRKLIQMEDIHAIMTAHVFNARLDSSYPATLSKQVIEGVLRDSLGFEGVVFSDDMQMGAIRSYYGLESAIKLAIQAGVDVLVFANNSVYQEDIAERAVSIIARMVREGEIAESRIDRSYRRIMRLKRRYGIVQ